MRAAALTTVLLLCACASTTPTSPPPPGFDLSGEWRLVGDESEPPPRQGGFGDTRRSALRALARGGISRDFPVVAAKTMRIEQNADSMGIRYDNGEYRDISWGERERGMWTVKAGWEDGSLHIVSKAHDSEAHEKMMLAADGRSLTVDVDISAGGNFSVTRVFERVDGSAP